jgi:hypothetical protein
MRPIRQGRQSTLLVASDPPMHALTGHAEPGGDLGDLPAVRHHSYDRLVALFHDA